MHKVFVYGSLLKGLHNAYVLGDSNCIGKFETKKEFKMYDIGAYPAITDGKQAIKGEVYEVDDEVLARLDRLEGISSGFYFRREVTIPKLGEKALIYVGGNVLEFADKVIESGDYRTYLINK